MIIISGWMELDPAERDRVIAESAPLQAATRNDEPGCIAYALCCDPVEAGRVSVYECWESPEALEAHFQHPNFFATGALLRAHARPGGQVMKHRIEVSDAVRGPDGPTARFSCDG